MADFTTPTGAQAPAGPVAPEPDVTAVPAQPVQKDVEAGLVKDAVEAPHSNFDEAKAAVENVVEQAEQSVENAVDVSHTAVHAAVEAAYDAVEKAEAAVLDRARDAHGIGASVLHEASTYLHIKEPNGAKRIEQVLGGS